MERPRTFLNTLTTSSTTYVDLLTTKISEDAKGLCYFVLSIDPDPNALYQIIIARMLNTNDLELTAIWSVTLPHLTSGVYQGLMAGDQIIIRHKSATGASVKTGISLEFSEVVEAKEPCPTVPATPKVGLT